MLDLVRVVPELMKDLKFHLRALVANYVVRTLPAGVRESVDDAWILVGKESMRELLFDLDEPEVVDDIAVGVVENCDRTDIRNKMRALMLARAGNMTHAQYAAFLKEPDVCMGWFFHEDLRVVLDAWTTELLDDATAILDENRQRREARDILVRAEEAEAARREEKKRREAEAKRNRRSRKQQLNAEKQRAAREAKDAKEEARAAKWRIGTSGAKAQATITPAFSEDDIYPAVAPPPPPAVQAPATPLPAVCVRAAFTECRVCMEDVQACAIAFPCGHDQVCETCAAALIRDKLLACVQCMEPVCMYISSEGECICTSDGPM